MLTVPCDYFVTYSCYGWMCEAISYVRFIWEALKELNLKPVFGGNRVSLKRTIKLLSLVHGFLFLKPRQVRSDPK